jgi:putative ABC transport system substrate-binding protein
VPIAVQEPGALEGAFAAMARAQVDGLFVADDALFMTARTRLAELAATSRLPTMFAHRDFVPAGGLMSYGPSYSERFRLAATYVDKILKGRKPSDLPVEQAAKLEFVINLKTAQALGLTIPPTILFQADEVIR